MRKFWQVWYEYGGKSYDCFEHDETSLLSRLISITDAGGKITRIDEHEIKAG